MRALVGRAQRGVRVQLGQPGRLAAELVPRLALGVVAEQLQRDHRREQAREEDGQQEEGRKPEAKRPEHPYEGYAAARYAAGAGLRSEATL